MDVDKQAGEKPDDSTEVDLGAPEKIEISIVDDTPPEDQGRKPLAKDVLAEDPDADAEEYGEKVKKRISEMRHAVHDERRAREAAERRAAEAERLAQQALQQRQLVQRQYTYGEAAYAEDMVKAAKEAVAAAKAEYRRAYDAGDPDRVTDAAEKLSEAKNKEAQTTAWAAQAKQKVQAGALQTQERDIHSEQQRFPSQQASAPAVDRRAEEWHAANPWWNTDPEMTAAAWGVHERLTRAGVDPRRDAEKYYEEINATMRRRFPEYEWDDAESAQPRNKDGTFAPKKPATAPVAPVKRVSTGNPNPNKVVLTKTQVQLAEKLGISLEDYAREWVKSQQGA